MVHGKAYDVSLNPLVSPSYTFEQHLPSGLGSGALLNYNGIFLYCGGSLESNSQSSCYGFDLASTDNPVYFPSLLENRSGLSMVQISGNGVWAIGGAEEGKG